MSLDESSVLMDRALVTMCQELPESLGLYNTAKDQFSLAAIRGVPLLESVGPDSRKLVLIRDWMRAYEPAEDQPLSAEISMDSLKETDRRERKERERQLQEEKHAQLTSESAAESDDRKRRKRQRKKDKAAAKERERAAKAKAKGKEKDRAKPKKAAARQKKAKSKQSSGKTRASAAGGRKRHVQLDSDDDVLSIEESSSTSEESSSESSDSSDSDSDSRAKKRKKSSAGNLPPKEVVLSSDEDDEPNEMFDTDDPDVYEVEKILRKKAGASYGDPDLYEVKWEGYDETTWEPAGNISKDLIDEFEGQPVREDVYTVEEIVDRRSKRDPTTRLKTYQYKVKWVGYDDLTWEPAENLPHNLRRKFDQKYENRKRRRS